MRERGSDHIKRRLHPSQFEGEAKEEREREREMGNDNDSIDIERLHLGARRRRPTATDASGVNGRSVPDRLAPSEALKGQAKTKVHFRWAEKLHPTPDFV